MRAWRWRGDRSLIVAASTVAAALLTAGGASAAPPSYTLTPLGTLGTGTESRAFGINDSGQIVGWSFTSGSAGQHAFRYSGGLMSDLGTLGGATSSAHGINAGGDVVGWALNGSGVMRPVRWSNGTTTATDLGTLGGPSGEAFAINASGDIAGYSYTGGSPHAFRWSGGTMTDLATLGGTDSVAKGISASGQIVGYSKTGGNAAQAAFRTSGGVMSPLATLGGNSAANAINDSGDAVGYSYTTTGNTVFHPIRWSGATMTDLGSLGGPTGEAIAINTAGDIVGYSRISAGGSDNAFIYTGGGIYNLNAFDDSTATLTSGTGINRWGQVVGYGVINGASRGYILSPVGGGSWNSATGGTWQNAGRWSTGATPNPGTNTLFNTLATTFSSQVITFTDDGATKDLTVRRDAPNIDLAGHTLVVAGKLTMGTVSGETGYLLFHGGGSATILGDGANNVGSVTGSVGKLYVNDSSTVNVPGGTSWLGIGNQGNGELKIETGGTVNAHAGYVGYGTGGVGAVILSDAGSQWLGDSLTIGGNSAGSTLGTGTVTVNTGATIDVGSLFVWNSGGASNGLKLAGGTIRTGTVDFNGNGARFVNNWTSGTLEVTGGNVMISGGSGVGDIGPTLTLNATRQLSVGSSLYLGVATGAAGTLTLSSGVLAVKNSAYVGDSGSGNFTHSGGTHTVGTGTATRQFWIGVNETGVGTYAMNNAAASLTIAGTEFVGGWATGTTSGGVVTTYGGTFNQSAGSHTVTGELYVGYGTASTGAFALGGGTLTVGGSEYLGNDGTGSFTQSGGAHTVGTGEIVNLNIGMQQSGVGVYALTGAGATLTVSGAEYVGYSATGTTSGGVVTTYGGTFNQSDGSHTVTGELATGYTSGGTGSFTLSGGTLAVGGIEFVGHDGTGSFNQSGGAHSVGTPASPRNLYIGLGASATGTYTLSGTGSLVVTRDTYVGQSGAGTFAQSGGTHSVGSTLYVGYNAGSTGIYNLSGGVLNVADEVELRAGGTLNVSGGALTTRILDAGAGGALNLTGGTTTIAGGALIPSPSAALIVGGTATLNVANGLATATTRDVTVSGSNALLNLSAASDLTLTDASLLRVGTSSSTGTRPQATVTIGTGSDIVTPSLTLGVADSTTQQIIGFNQFGPIFATVPYYGSTGTINIASGGTLTVTNAATLTRGVINMNGGTFSVPNLVDNGAASIVWNSGTINLTNSDLTIGGPGLIPSPLMLDANRNLGVSGTTTVASGASLTLAGGAFSTANLAVSGTVSSTTGSLTIPGTTTVNSGGTLHVNGGTLTSGSLDVSGTLNLGGGSANISGATTFNASTTLVLGSGSLTTGTLTSAFPLNLSAGSVTSLGAATVPGDLQVTGGAFSAGSLVGNNIAVSAGTFAVTGGHSVASGKSLNVSGGSATVGSLDQHGTAALTGGSLAVSGPTTLNPGASTTVDGGTFSTGSISIGGALNLNSGTFNLTASPLTVGSGGLFGATFDIKRGMNVNITQATTVNAGAKISSIGGTFSSGASSVNNGTIALIDGSLAFTGAATNAAGGKISLIDATFDAGPALSNAGRINLTDGTLSGTINMTGAGVLNTAGDVVIAASVAGRAGLLAVDAGVTTLEAPVAAVGSVDVDAGGQLDLTDGRLVAAGQSLASVQSLIAADAIGSTLAGDETVSQVVAVAADDVDALTFGGVSVSPTDVLVMHTYVGDADLSGLINGDDFFRIDQGFSGSESGWANGDFDASGAIDADDYWLIDRNYSRNRPAMGAAAPAGVTSVPEPACVGLFISSATMLFRRRRSP